ncbi:MAG TPA: hypothetical protein DEB05_12065 [Firmicutes bacterium]|nr:hypothetical protein [Bacillota bacterium]
MGFCTLIKTDRVLYDEIVFCRDEETVPINEEVPAGSMILVDQSKVTVTVINCTPVVVSGVITSVTAQVHIRKDIVIDRPEPLPNLTLEFSFVRQFTCPLSKTPDGHAFIAPEDVVRAACQIVNITARDTMTLTTGTSPSFHQVLVMAAKLKLVVPHDQVFVGTCPSTVTANAVITLPTTG